MKTRPDEITLDPAPPVPLKKGKIADVTSLFGYMKEENQKFYGDFFHKDIPTLNDPTDQETSNIDDSDYDTIDYNVDLTSLLY